METGQGLIYSGRIAEGKYFLQNALTVSPELKDYAESILREIK
jgi:hypothetical protein